MKKTIGIIWLMWASNVVSAPLQDIDLSRALCKGNPMSISDFFPAGIKLKPNPRMTNFLLHARDGYVKNPITQVYSDDSMGFVGIKPELVGWGIALGERTPEERIFDPDDQSTHVLASLTTLKYLGVAYAVRGGFYDVQSRIFTAVDIQCKFPF